MHHFSKTTMMTIYVIVLFLSEFTLTVSFRLSRTDTDNHHSDDKHNSISLDDIANEKRACNGFPCMYSHLGSKAAHASLYNTLAGFIDDCINNPICDPGRRKRDNSDRIRRLIRTPVSKLHIFDTKRSKQRL